MDDFIEEILNLERGYKINALIHEKVFKKKVIWHHGVAFSDQVGALGLSPLPQYSTRIDDVWKVVEELTKLEYVKIKFEVSHYHGCFCTIIAPDKSQQEVPMKDAPYVSGEEMPLVICRAALLALNVEETM